MTQTRKVSGFGARYFLVNLIYVAPGAFFFWLMLQPLPETGLCFWIGAVGFVSCIAAGILLDVIRLGRFRCPECGALLPRHRPTFAERRVRYHCLKCDTIWDTDLSDPED